MRKTKGLACFVAANCDKFRSGEAYLLKNTKRRSASREVFCMYIYLLLLRPYFCIVDLFEGYRCASLSVSLDIPNG